MTVIYIRDAITIIKIEYLSITPQEIPHAPFQSILSL